MKGFLIGFLLVPFLFWVGGADIFTRSPETVLILVVSIIGGLIGHFVQCDMELGE